MHDELPIIQVNYDSDSNEEHYLRVNCGVAKYIQGYTKKLFRSEIQMKNNMVCEKKMTIY